MNYRQEAWLSVFGAYYAICGDGARSIRVADDMLRDRGDAVVARLAELEDPKGPDWDKAQPVPMEPASHG